MKVRWLLLGGLVTLLLVPALLVTTARLLEPPQGPWVRLVAFTPLGVVLYAAALLLLLLAWWRGAGFWRGTARLLVVVAVVGVLVHAYWASGPYVGTSSAEAGSGGTLRVLTSNLRFGEADTAQLVELAQREHADVLVLQEVTPVALEDLRSAGVDDAYPHVVGEADEGPAGTMVFSTYPLAKEHRVGTGFGSYRMTLRTPDGPVRLLAVHPRPPVGPARGWREDQVAVRSAARALTGPAVLAGDFNATMDHTPMRELVGRGSRDAATQSRSGWQPTWPAAGEVSRLGVPVPSLLPIDHVLTRDGLHAVRTESFTVPGTDHRALLAVLRR
ncbi:MAG: endonuclease/exonuclease/phosphatase family protein [Nocardioidaceae bacterium]|nr:endonuclease/exonuclease/phosphatase family protein [Nocardioidaceae bacterium]NUS52917.1 endonuclease/exonuclease/phosphatase family protein [Nocardioidaceae bacterium]